MAIRFRLSFVVALFVTGCTIFVTAPHLLAQGSLTPPGPPAPTMKTLDQVEARIPIDTAHATGNADYEFIISKPGSYYLTGNLTVTKTNGIDVTYPNVTLDLNGFQIARADATRAGHGIDLEASGALLKNGSVSGFDTGISSTSLSLRGISLIDLVATNCKFGIDITTGELENCRAYENDLGLEVIGYAVVHRCVAQANTTVGILVGSGSTVTQSIATSNKSDGFFVTKSTITGCTAYGNEGNGISLFGSTASHCSASGNGTAGAGSGFSSNDDSEIVNCTANGNVACGISAGNRNTISGCTAQHNFSDGIQFHDACLLRANNASSNGSGAVGIGLHGLGVRDRITECNASLNKADGILVIGDCTVANNHAGGNGTNGIYVSGGSGNRIDGNQVRDNVGTGILAGPNDLILRNSAGNNATNFSPASGNNFAPVQTVATQTNPSANTSF